jgi:hypothetical protein
MKNKQNKQRRLKASETAIIETGLKIAQKMVDGDIRSLRVPGTLNKYWVPSSSYHGHKYCVHLTPSDRKNACECIAHARRRRPCKHVAALKLAIESSRSS